MAVKVFMPRPVCQRHACDDDRALSVMRAESMVHPVINEGFAREAFFLHS